MNNPTSSVADRRACWVGAFFLALVAGLYFWRGMPWVHVDDLAFAGAGIELARTGQLANHTMDGWLTDFGTNKFYIQLPFSVYSLAAWIRLFGVHAEGFVLYEWIWYVVGGYGLVKALGRFGLPLGARLALATLYLTLSIQTGLRPEAEAFGLTFLGLSLIDSTASFGQRLAAALLLGFGLLTYPLVLAPAVPFAVAILSLERAPHAAGRGWWGEVLRAWLLPVGLAAGIVIGSFLAMIHLDLRAFWSAFNAHRHLRVNSGGSLTVYFRLITEYKETLFMLPPLLVLVACTLFVAIRWRRIEPGLRAVVTACAVAAIGCIFLYAAGAPRWVLLLALCAGCAVATGHTFRRYRWTIVIALVGLAAWSQCLWIVNASLRRFPDAAVLRAAREAALRSDKKVVVDSSTARYVFDYHLPERAGYLGYLKPWREGAPTTPTNENGDALQVVTAPFRAIAGADPTGASGHYPRIMIGHHEFKSLALCPDDPLVVP